MRLIDERFGTVMEVRMGGAVCGFSFDRIELSREDLAELISRLREDRTYDLTIQYLDHLCSRFNPPGSYVHASGNGEYKSKD